MRIGSRETQFIGGIRGEKNELDGLVDWNIRVQLGDLSINAMEATENEQLPMARWHKLKRAEALFHIYKADLTPRLTIFLLFNMLIDYCSCSMAGPYISSINLGCRLI